MHMTPKRSKVVVHIHFRRLDLTQEIGKSYAQRPGVEAPGRHLPINRRCSRQPMNRINSIITTFGEMP
jgi:hypothetical protein